MRMNSGKETIFVLLLGAVIALAGCTGEPKQAAKQGQQLNPYAADSVFVEVKKKLQQNPNDADAWFHLADLYERNAQYAEAVEAYAKVTALRPDMGYAWLKMGTAYDRMDKPAEAVAAFKKAAALSPNNALLFNNMGVAYGKLGKYREEAAALRKALKLRPGYSSAAFNLGMTYLKMKDRKAAMQQYEQLRKYDEGTASDLLRQIEMAGRNTE